MVTPLEICELGCNYLSVKNGIICQAQLVFPHFSNKKKPWKMNGERFTSKSHELKRKIDSKSNLHDFGFHVNFPGCKGDERVVCLKLFDVLYNSKRINMAKQKTEGFFQKALPREK